LRLALVFAISWGGALIVVGPGGIPGTRKQVEMLFPIALLAMVAGPSVAGILLTGLVHGRVGLREFAVLIARRLFQLRWDISTGEASQGLKGGSA
jgi:hypothetical protein